MKGFDHASYLSLIAKARFFQIEKLEWWIRKKRYLDAVKIEHEVSVLGENGEKIESKKLLDADQVVDYRHISGVRKAYGCPNDLESHKWLPGNAINKQAKCAKVC